MINKLKNLTKFKLNSESNSIYTVKLNDGIKYVTENYILSSGLEVEGNQYNIQSITEKYLTVFDIVFQQKKVSKILLTELIIVSNN
jgi:hypothetical protein